MGVEPGRNDDELRCKAVEPWQDLIGHDPPERGRARPGAQGQVHDRAMRAGVAVVAGAGVKGGLVGRDEQNAGVVLHKVLGSIAVMYVEVDDGDAGETMMVERVSGADGNIAKKAEAHRCLGLCVVTGGADGAEGTGRLAAHHGIDGAGHCPRRAPCGSERAGRHVRICVERAPARFRCGTAQGRKMGSGMNAENVILGAKRSGDTEKVEPIERVQDGVKAGDLFRVAGWRDMAKAIGVCDKCDGHEATEQEEAGRHKGAVMLQVRNASCGR